MAIENKELIIGEPKKRAVLNSGPDRTPPNNNGNEVEEERYKIQKPWIILIETLSEDGNRTIETKRKVDLDPTLDEFLMLEATSMTARAEKLRVSIKEASEGASRGKKRQKREDCVDYG